MEHQIDRVQLLKSLADESRLDIVNILAKEDSYVELIAAKLSLTPATVCYHLKKLEAAGLVKHSRSQFYMIYSLNTELLDRTLRDLLVGEDTTVDKEEAYRQEVLKNFFRYGKLSQLPVQRKKREIVLREILKDFESGREYTEKEVNAVILRYHEDYCTIRREMIAFGMMVRRDGVYRRIQGG